MWTSVLPVLAPAVKEGDRRRHFKWFFLLKKDMASELKVPTTRRMRSLPREPWREGQSPDLALCLGREHSAEWDLQRTPLLEHGVGSLDCSQ